MKPDRKEVEALLKAVTPQEIGGGHYVTIPPDTIRVPVETLATLLRTQLAVWDAAVGITAWDASVLIVEFADDDPAGWNQGLRVRIVPEGA